MPNAPLGMRLDRVVAVVAELAGNREQFGSGFLVGGRVVLTAEHCTRDKLRADSPARSLRVIRASNWATVGVADVTASRALDVAVLHLAEPLPGSAELPAPVFARVDRAHAGTLTDCQAIGYPEWQRDPVKGTRDHAELHGTIYQTDEAESGRLLMHEPLIRPGRIEAAGAAADAQEGAVSPWRGFSGAIVFCRGQAIGVVVEHHPRQGDSALRVIAFDTIMRQGLSDPAAAEIAKELGLPTELPVAASSPITLRITPVNARSRRDIDAILGFAGPIRGREEELRKIQKFATSEREPPRDGARRDTGYLWYVGRAKAGKTTLFAKAADSLLSAGPQGTIPEVAVVGYFVSCLNAKNYYQCFLDSVISQLAELLPRPDRDVGRNASPDVFWRLWEKAAKFLAGQQRHLLLFVDALDEDGAMRSAGTDTDTDTLSIAAQLPKNVPANAHVLVSSRDQFALPRDVPQEHPLADTVPATAHRVPGRDQQRRCLE